MKNHTAIVSIEALPTFNWWGKLNEDEQKAITTETVETGKALHAVSEARLTVGERLYNAKTILEPHKCFEKWLKAMFHLSRATAYRYIDMYVAAKEIFPKPVLEVAMSRPDDRLSLKAIKAAPKPPKTNNVVAINKYLDKVQAAGRGDTKEAPGTGTAYLTKLAFHSLRLVLAKAANRNRRQVFEQAASMVMSELGIDKCTLTAIDVPESYTVKRGRPVTKAA